MIVLWCHRRNLVLSSSWRRFTSDPVVELVFHGLDYVQTEGVVVVAQDAEFYIWDLNERVVFTVVVGERR